VQHNPLLRLVTFLTHFLLHLACIVVLIPSIYVCTMNSGADNHNYWSNEDGSVASLGNQLKAATLFYLGHNIDKRKQNNIMCSPSETIKPIKVQTKSISSASWTTTLKYCLVAAFLSVSVLEFSLWFPFVLPGLTSAAAKTYIPASFVYDDEHTKFDNTPWTYNTDYLLTIVMSILAIQCILARSDDAQKNRRSLHLRLYSASLLICYAISTLAGAWAHQHFTSVESLNTTRFRMFWFICVGNVSFASCYMGLIGREVQRHFGVAGAVPTGPWWFWPAYGLYMAVTCGLGYISFKRPACDIFIAGVTQFPSTFYCVGALGFRKWPQQTSKKVLVGKETSIELVSKMYRAMYYIGFISNAPLLPVYPFLVQYTDWTLGGINAFLHIWLLVAWGLQGISLVHLCKAVSEGERRVETASEKKQFSGGPLLFYSVIAAPLALMAIDYARINFT